MNTSYDNSFYNQRRANTLPAAQKILSLVQQVIPISSIADIGCGTGTWLSVALNAGATKAYGFEGEWLRKDMLDDDKISLTNLDLEKPLTLPEPVSLAMSLEVAEHLSERRAESFVHDICSASNAVLFGAAIPLQGGRGHINEQWQSYWATKFEAQGYAAYDVIRPHVWGQTDIPYWYQQNTILYIRTDVEIADIRHARRSPHQLDIVHPHLFERIRKKTLSYKLRKIMSRINPKEKR
jgi:hypothetical protein